MRVVLPAVAPDRAVAHARTAASIDGLRTASSAELARLPRAAARGEAGLRGRGRRRSPSASRTSPYHIITGAGLDLAARPSTTACASSRRCSGSAPGRCTPRTSSTARWNWSSEGVSVILLKGEDARAPARRPRREVRAGLHRQGVRARRGGLSRCPGISADARALISPVLLATVLERLSAHLEVLRDHPLTTRRYYKRVAY